jgi:hypothetical protein
MVRRIKRPRVRGWLRVAEKPRSRFIVLVLCLHNINNNNVIIIVFNSFDIQIQLSFGGVAAFDFGQMKVIKYTLDLPQIDPCIIPARHSLPARATYSGAKTVAFPFSRKNAPPAIALAARYSSRRLATSAYVPGLQKSSSLCFSLKITALRISWKAE